MKKNEIIDISKENLCPKCNKPLNFEWESINSNNKIATCCNKEYWIAPSNIYVITAIKDETYNNINVDSKKECDLNCECSASTTYEKIDLINNKTIGNFKANSSVGQVDIFIKFGYIRVSNKINSWYFNINDKAEFCERDNDILLVADKENLKGIVIYKPLERVEINLDEIVSFEGWEQVRKFDPNIKCEV